ncbi:hypothetical protein [Chitinophaga caseinilytica]|uniref:Uncharacterized protein n=1 Tax=Chitinophaga caseinilytica TaxID=2267521 RepID=A0ABZ2Z4U9_9BACT
MKRLSFLFVAAVLGAVPFMSFVDGDETGGGVGTQDCYTSMNLSCGEYNGMPLGTRTACQYNGVFGGKIACTSFGCMNDAMADYKCRKEGNLIISEMTPR